MSSRWWSRTELLGVNLIWLVRMEWAGRVVYLSANGTTAEDPETGQVVKWRPGIDPFTWTEELDLFSLSPANRSLTLSVYPHWLDVAGLITDHRDLHQCTVRVYRYAVGGRSILYFSGRVRDYSFGRRGSPVELSIDANPWDDNGNLMPETARVDATTWPSAASKTIGERYPVVIGQPGNISDDNYVQAVPAYAVDNSEKYVLIAGHAVTATQVRLFQNGGTEAVGPVEHVRDGRGRLVAVADTHNHFTGITYHPDEDYRTSWTEGPGLAMEGGQGIRTAGDVIRWAVRQSTAPWDAVSVEVACGLLNSYAIDTSILSPPSEGLTPWRWLAAQVLPLVPVSIVGTSRGLGLHVWPMSKNPIVGLRNGSQGVERASRVQSMDRTRLITSTSIRYAYDALAGVYAERVAAVAEELDAVNGASVHRNLQVGFGRYGKGVEEDTTSDAVYQASAAGAYVNWRARMMGVPAWTVSYELAAEWNWLRLGDQVTITDTEIGWDSKLAVLQRVEHLPNSRMLIELRVQDAG